MHSGQLDAQGKAIVEVQQQNAELKKEIASHQEELQIASAKLICRCYCNVCLCTKHLCMMSFHLQCRTWCGSMYANCMQM